MTMCWLIPKSFEGSSENLEILRFGDWSQLGSRHRGDVENEATDDGNFKLVFVDVPCKPARLRARYP